jgi:hypothetical protein
MSARQARGEREGIIMANYYVNFSNQTQQTWTMGVYQTLPDSIGLDSVSWQQTTVPQNGYSGVLWTVSYNVCIANYVQQGGIGVYTASQTLPAMLGTSWNIVFTEGVQQLQANGSAPQGNQIIINNGSNSYANPGIGMSGQGSVFQNDVASGAAAQFTVTPTYYVGLFNHVQLGEVISTNVTVGPLELQFPTGQNTALLTASMDGDNIVTSISYSSQSSTSLADIARRKGRHQLLLQR